MQVHTFVFVFFLFFFMACSSLWRMCVSASENWSLGWKERGSGLNVWTDFLCIAACPWQVSPTSQMYKAHIGVLCVCVHIY